MTANKKRVGETRIAGVKKKSRGGNAAYEIRCKDAIPSRI